MQASTDGASLRLVHGARRRRQAQGACSSLPLALGWRVKHWNTDSPNTIASSRKSPVTAWNSTSWFFDNAHMEPGVAVELKIGLILVIYTTVSTNGWSLQHGLPCTTPPFVESWMPGYLLVDCITTAISWKVVQRSAKPLMLPTRKWELAGPCTGMGTSDALQRLEGPGRAGALLAAIRRGGYVGRRGGDHGGAGGAGVGCGHRTLLGVVLSVSKVQMLLDRQWQFIYMHFLHSEGRILISLFADRSRHLYPASCHVCWVRTSGYNIG